MSTRRCLCQPALSICLLMIAGATSWGDKSASSADESKVQLSVAIADPLVLENTATTTYLKVGLTGFQLPSAADRAPVNIAFVIDKSSSMTGEKIEKAKIAAMAAIDRLRSSDIVSVVAYDHGVQVVLPSTKLTDKELAKNAIKKIQAGGSTALFAGISKGAAEVRKFLSDNRVNRVILLSDGQANVGPNSPSELGDFGASLLKEQIAVTTLGLGLDYNEDLMWKLAAKSNGNHLFIEDASQLMDIFDQEFQDVLSVVAQEVVIEIQISDGIRIDPSNGVLGQDAEIRGQNVAVQLNQLYAQQERFILLEVDLPPFKKSDLGKGDGQLTIGKVNVAYANMLTNETEFLSVASTVQVDSSPRRCRASKNHDVLEKWVLLESNRQSQIATKLRDQGRIEEARQRLLANDAFLRSNAELLDSDLLRFQQATNFSQSNVISDPNWKKNRKLMRRDQNALQIQAPGYGQYGGGYGGGYGRQGGYGQESGGIDKVGKNDSDSPQTQRNPRQGKSGY